MPCLVSRRERPLGPHVSEPRSHVFKPHPPSLTLTLSSLALSSLTIPSLALTLLSLTFSRLALTSSSITLSNLAPLSHSSDLTLLGLILLSLYTSSTPPDPHLRNICPVLATLVVRRVSKRASRRTYKNNVSGMKLGCRAIKIGAR